jgi:acyl-CoA synthetase (AMP-forming)/AMP-acid ligase II
MRSLKNVSAATCVTFDDRGELGIVAFVVTEKPMSVQDLRGAALERLPEAMLPNRIELVEVLPLNKSNKLDERRLLSEANLRPLLRAVAPGSAR